MIEITINKISNLNNENFESPSRCFLFNKMHITEVNLSYGFKGKPYIINNPAYFNISHSKEYIGIAISENEVGFDLENNRELNDDKKNRLFKKIFNENDSIHASEFSSFELLKVWTIKEAYLKFLGIGIITDPKRINIDYENKYVSLDNYTKGSFLNAYNCDIIYTVVTKNRDSIDLIKEYENENM